MQKCHSNYIDRIQQVANVREISFLLTVQWVQPMSWRPLTSQSCSSFSLIDANSVVPPGQSVWEHSEFAMNEFHLPAIYWEVGQGWPPGATAPTRHVVPTIVIGFCKVLFIFLWWRRVWCSMEPRGNCSNLMFSEGENWVQRLLSEYSSVNWKHGYSK